MKKYELSVHLCMAVAAIVTVFAVGSSEAMPPPSTTLDLTVTTESPVYSPGDTVSVTVLAVHPDGNPVTWAGRTNITILDSDGKRRLRSTLQFAGDGRFTAVYELPANL